MPVKKTYQKPVLVRRGKMSKITADYGGGSPIRGSG
ncbi:putative RiPP precursor [Mesorhizobium sp. KR9-304]